MIVSVSRRTDIPAFYSEWFFNRLKDGFVYVVNPMNSNQVSKVELTPDKVDCFVFWTKDATPMIHRLDELKEYNYYFQYTITPYKADIEKGIKDKKEVINNFKNLSKIIGKERVILRYDPILINEKHNIEYHIKAFDKLCYQLQGYTEKCIISFIDYYKKIDKNFKSLGLTPIDNVKIRTIAREFSNIANKYGLQLETCSEDYDLSEFNISNAKCIDADLISKIIGYEVIVKKDDTQRDVCGCVKSVDIGQYNTCKHHCLYCYANFNHEQASKNYSLHDESNPLLSGIIDDNKKVTVRDMKSIKGEKIGGYQIDIFKNLKI